MHYLGASLDGIVFDQQTGTYGVLEVKCSCTGKASSLKDFVKLKNDTV